LGLYYDPYFLGKYPQIFYDYISQNKINFEVSKSDLNFMKKYHVDIIG
jgi:beta-glucosidase/6-phospho-beta-glucosidase/beta-galactosidase